MVDSLFFCYKIIVNQLILVGSLQLIVLPSSPTVGLPKLCTAGYYLAIQFSE